MEEALNNQVNQRLMYHLYTHIKKTSFFNVLLALIVVFNFKLIDHMAFSESFSWFGLLVFLSCARFLSARSALVAEKKIMDTRYHLLMIILLFVTGVTWGMVYFAYYEQTSVFIRMLLLLVIAGVSSGSIVSLSASPWCYYSSVSPTVVLILWKNASIGSLESISVILVLLTYVIFLLLIYPANHKLLVQNIKLDLTQKKLIRQLQQFNERLSLVSITDDLTKLANRRCFNERLLSDWIRAKRLTLNMSLLLIDVDYFKEYNDNYGHLAGDDCLRQIASIVGKAAYRETDLAARIGGDEIAILLFATGKEAAVKLAQRITDTLKAASIKHQYSPISDRVTLSIGVCSWVPDIDDNYEALIHCADQALYKAKERGRNTVVTY